MNAYIIQKTSNPIPGEGQINYPLTYNTVTMGRDSTRCQIVLDSQYYQGVSRVHLEIRPVIYQNNITAWEICDYSSNGTYVNQKRITAPQILRGGDVIKLGKNGPEFFFQIQLTNNNRQPLQPALNSTDLSLTQLLPILSSKHDLLKKGFLIPGILTVLLVVGLFISIGNSTVFNGLLGLYLIGIGYYFIYQLCGKYKPWWLLIGIAIAEIIILLSPILILFIIIFRGILPGDIQQNNFMTAFISNFFGAGLMEELLKALPVFLLIFISRFLKSPWRERIGVWEPLDGIVMVAAAGAGFTFLETLGQYVPGTIESHGELVGIHLLIPRIIGSVAGHMAYSGYFGYFIGLSMLKPSKRWVLLGIGWLTSATLHGLWNATGSVSFYILALVGMISYVFLIAAILKARQLSPTRSQNFATQFHDPNL